MFEEDVKIIEQPITRADLRKLTKQFGNMVKGVVDIEREIMSLGGELHADEEAVLLEQGSKQQNLWGVNLYPDETGEKFIEFDSMINIRPSQNNRSRGVENFEIRKKIAVIVNNLVQD